eukprot:15453512-Alexandrium_andersonii.AAC.1
MVSAHQIGSFHIHNSQTIPQGHVEKAESRGTAISCLWVRARASQRRCHSCERDNAAPIAKGW